MDLVIPPPQAIYHMRQPRTPQFRFEWHPGKKRVYLIRVGQVPEVGQTIAVDVETHGAAYNAVLIWSRGYHEGAGTNVIQPE